METILHNFYEYAYASESNLLGPLAPLIVILADLLTPFWVWPTGNNLAPPGRPRAGKRFGEAMLQ